jgi:hypothetical protein
MILDANLRRRVHETGGFVLEVIDTMQSAQEDEANI